MNIVTYWWTNWGPLIFVLLVALCREVYDDLARAKRDKKVNNQQYERIEIDSNYKFAVRKQVSASQIAVGDLIILHENERVPCDMVLLFCSAEKTFIRTDQLDGETDWKLVCLFFLKVMLLTISVLMLFYLEKTNFSGSEAV